MDIICLLYTSIEAEASGTLLKILKQDGEIVPVITTIAYIGDEGDVIPESASEPVKEEVKEEVKETPKEEKVEVKTETKKELKDGEYDVVVIGGGPAGYYSAIKSAQKGAKAVSYTHLSFFILTFILYLSIHSFEREAKTLSDNFVPLYFNVIIFSCNFEEFIIPSTSSFNFASFSESNCSFAIKGVELLYRCV